MSLDSNFRGQMESLIPQICHERTTLRSALQHAVADVSQHTVRLAFYPPPPHLSSSLLVQP
jgi:ABC-type thiamine transport system ATPase subunit